MAQKVKPKSLIQIIDISAINFYLAGAEAFLLRSRYVTNFNWQNTIYIVRHFFRFSCAQNFCTRKGWTTPDYSITRLLQSLGQRENWPKIERQNFMDKIVWIWLAGWMQLWRIAGQPFLFLFEHFFCIFSIVNVCFREILMRVNKIVYLEKNNLEFTKNTKEKNKCKSPIKLISPLLIPKICKTTSRTFLIKSNIP